MRKVFYLVAITAVALITGCKKENEEQIVPDPELNLKSTENIVVPSEGGTATVAYEIVNPVKGGAISAEASVEWISNFSYGSDSEVSFEVEANTVTEERNAEITLIYTYGDGSTVEAVAKLVQDAFVEVPDPEIKIEESEITVPAEGGQAEFAIEIINPVEGGSISAMANVNWIAVTSVTNTTIIFNAEENTDSNIREGVVTVTYAYGDGKALQKQVNVTQEARIPDPEIYIEQSSITVPAEGGQAEFAIEIINPVEGGSISAMADVNWIAVTSATSTTIIFNAEENTDSNIREGVVTVTYAYGDGMTLQKHVNVTQEAAAQSSEYDYEYELVKAEGNYYTSGYNTYITFGSTDFSGMTDPNTAYYKFDMYSSGPNNRLPTEGTYNFAIEAERMTFAEEYSDVKIYNENGSKILEVKFSGGTIEVSYEGDNMILEGFLTDKNGKTHHITYNGPKPSL